MVGSKARSLWRRYCCSQRHPRRQYHWRCSCLKRGEDYPIKERQALVIMERLLTQRKFYTGLTVSLHPGVMRCFGVTRLIPQMSDITNVYIYINVRRLFTLSRGIFSSSTLAVLASQDYFMNHVRKVASEERHWVAYLHRSHWMYCSKGY